MSENAEDTASRGGVAWFLEELYYSAYINDDALDDVDPGYEYAVQQLCSDLIARTHLTKNDEVEAMNRAQNRHSDIGAEKRSPSWQLAPIVDVSERWNLTPEESEEFLENIGYYESHADAEDN
jgi:hypothetical protein